MGSQLFTLYNQGWQGEVDCLGQQMGTDGTLHLSNTCTVTSPYLNLPPRFLLCSPIEVSWKRLSPPSCQCGCCHHYCHHPIIASSLLIEDCPIRRKTWRWQRVPAMFVKGKKKGGFCLGVHSRLQAGISGSCVCVTTASSSPGQVRGSGHLGGRMKQWQQRDAKWDFVSFVCVTSKMEAAEYGS